MADRFYCVDLSGPTALLSDTEAHHALHVLRLASGDPIDLFDGCGTVARGVVESTTRRDVIVAVKERKFHERTTRTKVTIAASPPKGDRLKWMIEKLTELGVDRYIPLKTKRSVVDPGKSKLHKLQATIINAAKQCGRSWLLEIQEPIDLAALIANVDSQQRLHIAHPYAVNAAPSDVSELNSHLVLVGPEGGFTDDEVELAVGAGANQLNWPDTILRVETAAIVAAIVLRH